MKFSQTNIGVLSVVFAAFAHATMPIFSKLINGEIHPFYFVMFAWILAGICFGILLMIKKINPLMKWKASISKKEIIIAGLINGLIVNGLIFYGLEYTTAINMIILGTSEMFFSYLLFHFWKAEKEKIAHMFGSLFIFSGIIIIFWNNILEFNFNIGDLIILGAFAISPIGNFFQQKALKKGESSSFILFCRTIIVVLFLLILILLLDIKPPSVEVIQHNMLWIMGIGILIFGLGKIFWLKGIKLISIPKATSIILLQIPIAIILAYIILDESLHLNQLLSLIPITIGVLLLIKK